jgi:hypothetical protein
MLSPVSGTDWTMYRWENRLLMVFAPTQSDVGYLEFEKDLSKSTPELMDRDLVVFRIFEKARSRVGEQLIESEDAEQLRRRFEVRRGKFTVILIGKDGGVKVTREGRVELEEIFDRIDSMPMRQREMREKRKTRLEKK